jgi:hypothetical protein
MLHLEVKIMCIGLGTKFDLLDHHCRLMLTGSLFFLGLLVLKLPEVHDAANWRNSARADLYEIQPLLFREPHGFVCRQDSNLPTIRADNANFRHANAAPNTKIIRCTTSRTLSGTLISTWPCDALSSVSLLVVLLAAAI